MKNIILGVTASISAYKSADITSKLKKNDFNVHVIMTKNSTSFINPLTLQSLSKHFVYTDVLQENNPSEIVHISLAKKADCILISPATANIIGKIASGIADDMLTSIVLASKSIPKFIAPAMNNVMYENSIVQDNINKLKNHGWNVIEPRESLLACGDYGKGALADVNEIINIVISTLTRIK